ncbi:MAG TPA: RsmE family RNA methyltransferase [Fibrobacteria bacterium]|nr:RsmE family RNA methyltransferase [Fibrobacteria bacterium]
MPPFHDETWIFAPTAGVGERISLDPVESTHLVRVLRLAPGTFCTVTDGRGSVVTARLEVADPRGSILLCESLQRRDPEPGRSLAQAILKNRGLEEVLDLCAQTPVREFQPIWTERVQVPRGRDIDHQMDRLRAKAVAALQQSKQSWLCRVLPPLGWVEWLDRSRDRPVLVCDDSGQDAPTPDAAWIAIGPEGGHSPAELREAADRGAQMLSLGTSRLRATAAGFWALARR